MKFILSDSAYKKNIAILDTLGKELALIARKAGTSNPKFDKAWGNLYKHLQSDQFHRYRVENRFDVRALAIALNGDKKLREKIKLDITLLNQITEIVKKGSSLFNDALYQYYLLNFEDIDDVKALGEWLLKARVVKGQGLPSDSIILAPDGPKRIANDAIANNLTFQKQLDRLSLNTYASGQYLKRSHSIYYVEQLNEIPVNRPHELLDEVTIPDVFNAKYDDEQLIGHKVLDILLTRSPIQDVHDSWQNAVIAIAGDPRVPKSHPKYLKWWSHVSEAQIKKVRGWLSKLDLKLFLEALEDFSESSRDEGMKRMFPSRKKFLEGMHKAGAINETKLYLSKKAERYLKRNYKAEHIPEYSVVVDGDISIIYADLTHGHMIEGSHNCKIWFYEYLDESAPVLEDGKQLAFYRDLTGGLNRKMSIEGHGALDYFQHSPSNFNWQHKSIQTLQKMNVNIRASDVLSQNDYSRYKRIYGVY
jgi:hypothetical protein